MDEEILEQLSCPQIELALLGSFFKRPVTYLSYMDVVANDDFSDSSTRFYAVFIHGYVLNFSSQEITPALANTYASEDNTRLSAYKKFGGYQTIRNMMELAFDEDDGMNNAVNTLKKYSLLRKLHKEGYPLESVLGHPHFKELSGEDIFALLSGKLNTIGNDTLSSISAPEDFTKGIGNFLTGFFEAPSKGHPCPWQAFDKILLGVHPADTICSIQESNSGKSRQLMYLLCYLAFISDAKVLLLSNEMSREKMLSCAITTCANAPWMQKLTGCNINIPEKRIVTGLYKENGDNGFMYRYKNQNGEYIETVDEFRKRVESKSDEFNQVQEVLRFVEKNMANRFLFKDVTSNYSDEAIVRMVNQAAITMGVDVLGYDTCKPWSGKSDKNAPQWLQFYQTVTKFTEAIQKVKTVAGIFTAQADRGAIHTPIENIAIDNIANASQIYHLLDGAYMFKHILPNEYERYAIKNPNSAWGEDGEESLNPDKKYCAMRILKNRRNNKGDTYIFEVDLDRNLWIQLDNCELIVKKEVTTSYGKKK